MFSIVCAAILRPLPYPSPDELVTAHVLEASGSGRTGAFPSLDDVRLWRTQGHVFSAAGVTHGASSIIVEGAQPERLTVQEVSEGYLEVFGVSPVVGRLIGREDVSVGAPAVVMIGARYWQGHLGGRSEVVGTVLRCPEGPATIIGVVPESFSAETAVWRPLQSRDLARADRRGGGLRTYARLRDLYSRDEAQRALTSLVGLQASGEPAKAVGVRLDSLYESTTSAYLPTLRTFTWAVGLVLLIACANVSSLLLARGRVRRPEIALRASLGASRGRLVRQLLTESLVLGLAGGGAGIVLAWATIDVLVSVVPISLPTNAPAVVDVSVFAFGVALAVSTSVLFGLIPALSLTRETLGVRLGQASRRVSGTLSRRSGQVLVGVEVALAVILLTAAGLLLRSLARVEATGIGFDPERVILVSSEPVDRTPTVFAEYYSELLKFLKTIPGVEAAGAVDLAPLSGIDSVTFAQLPGDRSVEIHDRRVLPSYFKALGLSLRAGREFGDADLQGAAMRTVLNEQAAKLLFPGASAVGRIVTIHGASHEIIGVVGDVRYGGPLWPSSAEAYFLPDPSVARPLTAVLLVSPGSAIPLDRIRQIAQGMGPRIVFEGARSESVALADRTVAPRHRAMLFGILGGLGLVLALVGIAGMTAYSVAQRTREVGIRIACGARPSVVVRAIVKDSAWPIAIGLLVGISGAMVGTKVIASFLFETKSTDPATFATAAALLGFTALVASWLPARRAARVDPVQALRAE